MRGTAARKRDIGRVSSGAHDAGTLQDMTGSRDSDTVSGDFTLTMDELRAVTDFVVMHAEDVLDVFEQAVPGDPRPRAAVEAARVFVGGARRTNLQRAASLDAHRAARSAPTEAARLAARCAGDAASAAYLHPIARATQVGHILRAAATVAYIAELRADGEDRGDGEDRADGEDRGDGVDVGVAGGAGAGLHPAAVSDPGAVSLERSRQRATAVLVAVLRRYPEPTPGRSRVGQLLHALDRSLRGSSDAVPRDPSDRLTGLPGPGTAPLSGPGTPSDGKVPGSGRARG